MSLIANARMYAVTPEAEAAWRSVLEHVAAEAGLGFDYLPYPAPQPLEDRWGRPDLGCVQMCGYPIALGLAEVHPIAAPIPAAAWAGGRPVYRSDLIVRADSPYRTLADSFGGTLGWTVEHSHSGFNALRHHLLTRRPEGSATAYRRAVGPLVTARRILDSVLDGTIDIGPLDSYWHLLIRKYRPDLVAGIRVLESTDLAPLPAFVSGPRLEEADRRRLASAFEAAGAAPWFGPLAEALCIEGFRAVTREDFAPTLQWDRDAKAAGYTHPA